MDELRKYAQNIVKIELMKARVEFFQNESGNKSIEFILKNSLGKYHEIYLQPINLEKVRSVKIPKIELGKLSENLWIALVLLMKDMNPVVYLIPSKTFENPDNNIFIGNNQIDRFKHWSNWEIKVFSKAIFELSKYEFKEMVKMLNY